MHQLRLAEIASQGQIETTTNNKQQPTTMITQFPTDASFQTQMSTTNIRVCTQIKIDPTLTLTIKITTVLGKTTPTEPATVVVQRDTLPSTAPNQPFGTSGTTLPHMTQQLADPNPGQAHLWNHQVQVATTSLNHPTSTTPQATHQFQYTPHNYHQLH